MVTGNEFIDVVVALFVAYGVVYLFAIRALRREDERRRRVVIERIEAIQREKEKEWISYLSSEDSASGQQSSRSFGVSAPPQGIRTGRWSAGKKK